MNTYEVVFSRSGLPCLWERGGRFTNIGDAVIIADQHGNPKKAIHVRTHGMLACDNHALIPVKVGDLIITATRHRDLVDVVVEQISKIEDGNVYTVYHQGSLNGHAIEAAIAKSDEYHCRTPYYIK